MSGVTSDMSEESQDRVAGYLDMSGVTFDMSKMSLSMTSVNWGMSG